MKRLWHTPGLLNALANALILLSLLGLLCAAGWWLAQRPGLALRVVRIDAAPGTELRHVSAVLLDQSVRQRLRGNFFTVDLDAVRAGFEQVPWVRRAMVRRVWPDRLEVAIEEHRPLATWGENQLMNTFGELYTANAAEAEEDGPLPHFSGPPGSEQRMLGRYDRSSDLGLRQCAAGLGRDGRCQEKDVDYATYPEALRAFLLRTGYFPPGGPGRRGAVPGLLDLTGPLP